MPKNEFDGIDALHWSIFNTPTRICKGTEPQCRKMVGTLNYIKVEDCQSEQQIEINYCEVRYYEHTHTLTLTLSSAVFFMFFFYSCVSVFIRANVTASPCTPWNGSQWNRNACAVLLYRRSPSPSLSCVQMALAVITPSCQSPHVTVFPNTVRRARGRKEGRE